MGFYEILGVTRESTAEEIKRSYRALALRYHPDKNPGNPEAERKFKEIAEAYATLSDLQKKVRYDAFGYAGRRPDNPPPPPEPPKPQPRPSGKPRNYIQEPPTRSELDAIHCMYYGGDDTGRHVLLHLALGEREMRAGGRRTVKVKKRLTCDRCVGDGRVKVLCPRCKGRSVPLDDGTWTTRADCNLCHGDGAVEQVCAACRGEGVARWTISEVSVVIPPNCAAGQTVMAYGEGETAPGKPPGNLRVTLLPG